MRGAKGGKEPNRGKSEKAMSRGKPAARAKKRWLRAGRAGQGGAASKGKVSMYKVWSIVLAVWISALTPANATAQGTTIRVGWTIPAEESKYWIMRRPAEFPNLGKAYKLEFTQFQGT